MVRTSMQVKQASELEILLELRKQRKKEIETRLREFQLLFKEAGEEDIFAELVFCLFTPQSKATSCWQTVETLKKNNLITCGGHKEISAHMKKVRFMNNKARYLIEARKHFTKNGAIHIKDLIRSFKNPFDIREWLAVNIKGLGYKEATHFLRNIGVSRQLAILDRHILKNLVRLGVIKGIPKTLSKKVYLDIESKMQSFAAAQGIPMNHMDFLLWSKEAGLIFK